MIDNAHGLPEAELGKVLTQFFFHQGRWRGIRTERRASCGAGPRRAAQCEAKANRRCSVFGGLAGWVIDGAGTGLTQSFRTFIVRVSFDGNHLDTQVGIRSQKVMV